MGNEAQHRYQCVVSQRIRGAYATFLQSLVSKVDVYVFIDATRVNVSLFRLSPVESSNPNGCQTLVSDKSSETSNVTSILPSSQRADTLKTAV